MADPYRRQNWRWDRGRWVRVVNDEDSTYRYGTGWDTDLDTDIQDFGSGNETRYMYSEGLEHVGDPYSPNLVEEREWLRPGPHTGKGPRNYHRPDNLIRDDVCDRLTVNGNIDATNVVIDVDQGEVTLRGMVSTRYEKRLAEDLADTVAGVKDVYNELTIHLDG